MSRPRLKDNGTVWRNNIVLNFRYVSSSVICFYLQGLKGKIFFGLAIVDT